MKNFVQAVLILLTLTLQTPYANVFGDGPGNSGAPNTFASIKVNLLQSDNYYSEPKKEIVKLFNKEEQNPQSKIAKYLDVLKQNHRLVSSFGGMISTEDVLYIEESNGHDGKGKWSRNITYLIVIRGGSARSTYPISFLKVLVNEDLDDSDIRTIDIEIQSEVTNISAVL